MVLWMYLRIMTVTEQNLTAEYIADKTISSKIVSEIDDCHNSVLKKN